MAINVHRISLTREKFHFPHYSLGEVIFQLIDVLGHFSVVFQSRNFFKVERSFYFFGVKNWNDIPDNVRDRDSIARFRTGLRDYLLNLSQDPNTTLW